MNKGFLLITIISLLSAPLFAQDDVEITTYPQTLKAKRADKRDLNIQRYPDHFFIWPVLKRRSLSFDIESLKGSKDKLTYKPNNALTFGVGLYLFELGLEFTFAIPVDSKTIAERGHTHAKDFQINALTKRFGLDLYYQKYTGFYLSDSRIKRHSGDSIPKRGDIVTRNFGVSGSYIFNDKKFSFKSSYNFAERQLKSGGSFLLVGTLNSFKLTADSSVLSYQYRPVFGTGSSFEKLKYTTFSIAPGYTYSVIYKHFFFNATLVFGPANNWVYYRAPNGKGHNDITINTYTAVRVGMGYNSDHFFAGVNFVSQSRNVRFEDIRFSNSSETFKLLVGYRFREFGFLKKSVWDIPREISKRMNSN